jgi:hypothetical protein
VTKSDFAKQSLSRTASYDSETPLIEGETVEERRKRMIIISSLPLYSLNVDDLTSSVKTLIEEYLLSAESEEARTCVEELRSPSHYAEIVAAILAVAVERSESERQQIDKLMEYFYQSKLFGTPNFVAG